MNKYNGIVTFDAPPTANRSVPTTLVAHAAVSEDGSGVIWLLAYRGSTLVESKRFDSSHEDEMFSMLRNYGISANLINKAYNSKFKYIFNPAAYLIDSANGNRDKIESLWFSDGSGIKEVSAD